MNRRSSSNDFRQLSALMVHFHSLSIQFRFISFLLNFISFNLERNSFNLTTRSCHSISRQLDRRSISSQIPISISFIGTHLRTLNVRIQLTWTSSVTVVLCNSYRIFFTSYSPFFTVFNYIISFSFSKFILIIFYIFLFFLIFSSSFTLFPNSMDITLTEWL